MAKYLEQLVRTKKNFIVLVFFYLITFLVSYKTISHIVQPSIEPALENQIFIPSDDGLVWKDTPKGIELQEIHNSYIHSLEIGDILIKIDQQPIFYSESLKEILKSLPPGSVLMYQIKRPSANDELVQVLIRTFPKVIFKPENTLFQWIYEIFNLSGLFLGILLVLLVYPFIQRGNDAFKIYLSCIFLILFCLLYLLLDFQPTIYQENTEAYFNYTGWILAVFFLVLSAFFLQLPKIHGNFFINGALMATIMYLVLSEKNLISYQTEIQILAIIIFCQSLLQFVYIKSLKNKNISFTILGCLLMILIIYYPNVYTYLFLWIFMLIFESYWIYKYLKISKVNLVTQQFVLIIILISVFSISYFLAGFIAQQFPYDFQNILRIILSFFTSLLVVYGLFLNKNWWKKWLFFSFENRNEKLQKFQISMTNYLHKEQLLEDFQKEIQDFLGEVKLEILLEVDKNHPYYSLFSYLSPNTFWSKSKELSKTPLNIPEHLMKVIDPEYELIFPLFFSDDKKGFIMIGKKKEGYFNLEEAELLQRTIIQLSLIINLLALLEKEKLLVQKTLEANLTALRSQINPHFLFNTLNTISSLIHDSPDLAEEAVEHLAFIFRYTLKTSNEQFATLKEEMQLIKHYLDIEKIRFGKRLNIEIQIQEKCLDVLIPSLVIQTLVENCIKHGISKLTKEGLIKIQFYLDETFLVGEIFDNGPGIKTENIYKGTGLSNILTRLEQIYGKNHEISLINTGNGTLVKLKIAILNAH